MKDINIIKATDVVTKWKKAGTNLVGTCPHCKKDPPTMTVNPEKQIYFCFGCGKKGKTQIFLRDDDNG